MPMHVAVDLQQGLRSLTPAAARRMRNEDASVVANMTQTVPVEATLSP